VHNSSWLAKKDVVILKTISPPSIDEFDALVADDRKKGKQAGLKKSDIKESVIPI